MLSSRARRPALCVLLLVASATGLRSQEIVGSYARDDAAGLKTALERSPDNAGLMLRLSMALLADSEKKPEKAAERMDEVQKHFRRVLELNPNAWIPLRALARDAYYSKKLEEAVT